jgi:hypothetical protein
MRMRRCRSGWGKQILGQRDDAGAGGVRARAIQTSAFFSIEAPERSEQLDCPHCRAPPRLFLGARRRCTSLSRTPCSSKSVIVVTRKECSERRADRSIPV